LVSKIILPRVPSVAILELLALLAVEDCLVQSLLRLELLVSCIFPLVFVYLAKTTPG
jgi:hypothetical protein